MTLPTSGRTTSVILFLLTLALSAAMPACAQEPTPNTLTSAERSAGWTLLFDGTTTKGWRGFRMTTMPAGLAGEETAPSPA